MRTFEEFIKQSQEAHNCKLCRGKIFAIRCDKMGNTYCGYCGQKVNYPRATNEELIAWMKQDEKWKLIEKELLK
jgi:hypothetical protein